MTVDSTVMAALQVFGLTELPKTQDELKAVYRRCVKQTHPDTSGGNSDTKPFQRVFKAREVLSEAIEEANKPCVLVKFGLGDPQPAKVAKNKLDDYEPAKDYAYIVALKWFMGLSIQVDGGAWYEVAEPVSFGLDNVWVHFV